jgi:hypothetical protein
MTGSVEANGFLNMIQYTMFNKAVKFVLMIPTSFNQNSDTSVANHIMSHLA